MTTTKHKSNQPPTPTMQCALITPHGTGGIAVIQLNGKSIRSFFAKCYTPFNSNTPITPRKLSFGQLLDNDEVIDQVIVHLHHNEQSLEIHCHGGPRVVQRIMMKLSALGCEIVSWEEINSCHTIAQEVYVTLAKSKTRLAITAFSKQATGGLTAWCQETLTSIRPAKTLSVDFHAAVAKLIKQYPQNLLLQHLTNVVLVGQPNVGKSTIANGICGRAQSIVCDLAGTTRDWTSEESEILGLPITIIDTPGIRDSNDPLEQASIKTAKKIIKQAKLLLYIITANQIDCLTQKDVDDFIKNLALRNDQTVLLIQNKIDIHEKIPFCDLAISANNFSDIENIKKAIIAHLGFTDYNPSDPMIFTARQYAIATQLQKATTPELATPLLQKMLDNQWH